MKLATSQGRWPLTLLAVASSLCLTTKEKGYSSASDSKHIVKPAVGQ